MSRLDKLLSLIENGSSPVIRKSAALQLGEVQKLHPHELHNLLASVGKFFHSSSWETRIAAGLALEAILKHVPEWNPTGSSEKGEIFVADNGKLSFETFNFETIISKSAYLMACDSIEFESFGNLDCSAENLEKQKKELNKKIGLEAAAALGIDTSSIYSTDDLKLTSSAQDVNQGKVSIGEVVGGSCREMNRARRKAKLALRRQSSRVCEEPESKLPRLDGPPTPSSVGPLTEPPSSLPVPDTTGLWPPEAQEWPLDWFCNSLCSDLFAARWEPRHGAATALRHLVSTLGKSGGKSNSVSSDQMDSCNQLWLEDIALRLVCVLSLDRFGDFVSDQVVAPVRETCAQALGSVALHMKKKQLIELVKVLLQLLEQKDWEARHGGLLGLKYTFAVRKDVLNVLVPMSIDSLHLALNDGTDDVGAVAGGALSIAVPVLVASLSSKAEAIFHTLAELLPHLDDLTPSANTFVPLMVDLLNHSHISENLKGSDKVEKLIVRVFFLMAHNNSSVRKAALETIKALSAYAGSLLQQCLRHVFQRALIEHDQSLTPIIKQVWCSLVDNSETVPLLEAACPYFSNWLCLAMQPTKLAYDPSLLLLIQKDNKSDFNSTPTNPKNDIIKPSELKLYLGGNETVPFEIREQNCLEARFCTCYMLGYLSKIIVKELPGAPEGSSLNCYTSLLVVYLNSKSALQRFITALTVSNWATLSPPAVIPKEFVERLNVCLNETVYYDEICPSYTKLRQETKDFIALLKHYQLPEADDYLNQNVLTFDQMESICCDQISVLINKIKIKKTVSTLESRRKSLKISITNTVKEFKTLNVMTQAALAGAVLKLGLLPEKLGPIIKPIMESIKKEHNWNLQKLSANHLCELMDYCLDRNPSPSSKIVTNLCFYAKCDPEFTPKITGLANSKDGKTADKSKPSNDPYNCIITLVKQQKFAERSLLKRSNSILSRGPGRPPKEATGEKETSSEPDIEEDSNQTSNEIARRGAMMTLRGLVCRYGENLPVKLPFLWQPLNQALNKRRTSVIVSTCNGGKKSPILGETQEKAEAEELVEVLQILEIIIPSLHVTLFSIVMSCFCRIVELIGHKYACVRHMAARVLATLTDRDPKISLPQIIKLVIPLLSAADSTAKRQGATEAVAMLLNSLQVAIVPYLSHLVIPIMGRISDQDVNVRLLANQTFASLIQLVPLGNLNLDSEVSDGKPSFLHNLFRPNTISDYKVPVPIEGTLRPYQQAGVNWLYFLNSYKLHGILCDDMGLGKTIQSICILAGDHYDRKKKYKKSRRPDCAPLPSLVVCPPTLTGHWMLEISKFLSKRYLNPLLYTGTPTDRKRLQYLVKDHNLIIASYDIVRNDIDFFSAIKWNYCILDEGHVIKNVKTKWTKAIKTLEANHRLILSGTPIQNNVLELWSLFDFLMPGFLGTEKQFNSKYSRPILLSRDPKSTSKEQQAGVLAMEALHRQVLPFILRRLKEDVLKELPPKITQDYYCELSPLQKQLYDDFSNTQVQNFNSASIEMKQTHIFQALRYMQSVCNHPKLAINPKLPNYKDLVSQLSAQGSNLNDIKHAAKLPALKQLLWDCGIGVEENEGDMSGAENMVVNQHRALIFCQLKAMLDILEKDFFKAHMPSVSYLRLDSTVPSKQRFKIVQLFNNDPSYDVLLLTTKVGGLGLNLTGADTVIFVEHDWSPMRDLQAMDRAHRIGQKKVVNVYRLITKNTLEEKIMGLQKFKLLTANTVISSENACLETMGTEKLLELFSGELGKGKQDRDDISSCSNVNQKGMKSVLDALPPLSDSNDYEEEYDMSYFLSSVLPSANNQNLSI